MLCLKANLMDQRHVRVTYNGPCSWAPRLRAKTSLPVTSDSLLPSTTFSPHPRRLGTTQLYDSIFTFVHDIQNKEVMLTRSLRPRTYRCECEGLEMMIRLHDSIAQSGKSWSKTKSSEIL